MLDKADADSKLKQKRALKVLHVIPSVAPCRGGPSKAIIEMVSALRSHGIDADIATTNDNGPGLLDVELNKKVDYKGVPIRFFKRYSPPIKAIREFAYSGDFKCWLKGNVANYDLVHVHAVFSFCSSYTMALARKNSVPYIIRPIGQLQKWSLEQAATKKSLYLKIIERQNIEAASAVQFTASSEQQETEQLFTVNGHIIPLGIIPPPPSAWTKQQVLERLKVEDSKLNLLYLSRLHEKKGVELLIQAVAELNADIRLWIAGDGDSAYREHLDRYVDQLGVSQRCCFIGHVEGEFKNELLQHADLYALTSYSENFGISVLEAMSAGLAPLITKGVALSEVVEYEKLGLVSEPNKDEIKDNLMFALSNKKALDRFGELSAQYAQKHYSWSQVSERLTRLYNRVTKT